MEEMKYTITLADGTEIGNLRLNGNNFVSETEVTEDLFDGNLETVTISDGTTETVMHDAELVQIAQYADGWYFILREIPADVLDKRRIEANIDYIAMMTDVEL